MVINELARQQLGLHIGSKAELGFESNAQILANYSGNDFRVVKLSVVGIIETSDQVIQDQVNTLGGGVWFSPALTRQLAPDYATFSGVALQVRGGAATVSKVTAQATPADPEGLSSATGSTPTSVQVALAQQARPSDRWPSPSRYSAFWPGWRH